MKRSIFKPLAASVIILAQLITMISCGEKAPEESQASTSGVTDAGSTAETAAPLEKKDFGGIDYIIVTRDSSQGDWGNYDIVAENETGETINDAIYKRNLQMDEDFGVIVGQYGVNDVAGTVRKSASSGDNNFNSIISSFWDAASLSTDGYLAMLTDIDTLNLDGT